MKRFLGKLISWSLVALSGLAFAGSINDVMAQSPCLTDCRSSGRSEAVCRTYCIGNGTRVYGYRYAPGSTELPVAALPYFAFSDDWAVTRCWAGYWAGDAGPTYPCWAQRALSNEP